MTIGRAVWIALGALAGVVGLAHVRSPETGFAAAAPSMTADPDATNDEGAPLLQQAMLRQDRGKFRNLLAAGRSEEHTSELQSLMRISYAVFCLKKKKKKTVEQIN